MITVNQEKKIFHLKNKQVSYVFMVEEGGYLAHLYYGKAITAYSGTALYPRTNRSFSPNLPATTERVFSLDTLLMEYPSFGHGDFREPAQMIYHKNGTQVTDFVYQSYEITAGKPKLEGLPATYATVDEAATLTVTLKDSLSELELDLSYTIFLDYPVITRSVELKNTGKLSVEIKRLFSTAIDFSADEKEMIHLNGTWARERQMTREIIQTGTKKLDSKRGSSSHQQNPFIALVDPTTTEDQGEAYGFSFVYSGNHETLIEKDPYNQTRIMMGLNSFAFNWPLEVGQSFQTPEVVMVYANEGLNQMSATFHDLYNHHLIRGRYKNQVRPTLVNNWEATYFDFDEQKIMAIVDEAEQLGIEMFVLDDGWFGHREDDHTSLGDWFENEGKLACGLEGLAKQVHAKGMKFGIWFEPEMISETSRLFEEHPDWALQIPGRKLSPSRGQFVLDFSRAEVREHIYQQMKAILDRVPIDYIKWDMNRNMTEVYSSQLKVEEQGSVAHRYLLGLYDFLERLTNDYPEILFESCSGGGGRFDAGLLYYMPQTWTSDNTDAMARLGIQYGTSLVYPISSMGSHVSAIPNHQTERLTSLKTRGNVAMSGVFGYELDLNQLTELEKIEIKKQVTFYKKHRKLFQYGRFIRLLNPFESNDVAWIHVAKNQKTAILQYFRVLAEESYPLVRLKAAGLVPNKRYQMNGLIAYGDEWMTVGFYVDPDLKGDYQSETFYFKQID
ncbi:alpha-galactosidase [Vagococcus sp.]|uniref:alpha-galactosidase n=1 Tax=Vagococcus sp. TaxID=1933889 RepID=UPI003F9897A6